jgi:hypothetical protein
MAAENAPTKYLLIHRQSHRLSLRSTVIKIHRDALAIGNLSSWYGK